MIILVIFCVFGCATFPILTIERADKSPYQETCKSRRSTIGIFLKENKSNNLEISSIIKNSPAEKAQLRPGDVITMLNGTKIKSRYEFLRLLDEIPPGKSVNLTVRQGLKIIEKTVSVQEGFIYHDAKAIQSILASGKAIKLAIIIVDVNSILTTSNEKQEYEKWRKKTRSEIFLTLAAEFLHTYQGETNFRIIDKIMTEDIMKNIAFKQTEPISDNDKIKLGNTYGVTHLLLVDFSLQQPSPPFLKFTHVENHRLIEVKSGKTVAATSCRGGQ
jgi:membrane-associated protease RseP (regulator of RpoE activity)